MHRNLTTRLNQTRIGARAAYISIEFAMIATSVTRDLSVRGISRWGEPTGTRACRRLLLSQGPAVYSEGMSEMNDVDSYVLRVADFFNTRLGAALVEAYKLVSLAHGGFSAIYSDIDVGFLLDGAEPPAIMAEALVAAKDLDSEYGKKVSIFWGNSDYNWGRLPVIDRLDLLDHAVPLLRGHKPEFRRPTEGQVQKLVSR